MCERCSTLETMLRDSQASEAELADMVEALQRKLTQSCRAELALQRKLSEARESSPLAGEVRDVLEDWQTKTGHTKTKIPMDGVRAEKVTARLKQGFSVGELKKANTGAGRFPYVVNAQRRAHGNPEQRHDDAELVFRNEKTVEKFMELADRVELTAEEQRTVARVEKAVAESEAVDRRRERAAAQIPPPFQDPIDRVLIGLERLDCSWRNVGPTRWVAQCPVHDDRDPSLSITEREDGAALLHCFAGCRTDDIVIALGLRLRDLFATERAA